MGKIKIIESREVAPEKQLDILLNKEMAKCMGGNSPTCPTLCVVVSECPTNYACPTYVAPCSTQAVCLILGQCRVDEPTYPPPSPCTTLECWCNGANTRDECLD